MQLYKRIWIGFLVIFTVSGIQLSLAATEPMADLFQMGEVVVTGTKNGTAIERHTRYHGGHHTQ